MVKPWHAIANSNAKWYSYRFTLGPTLWNPMDRFTRTHFVHRPLFAPPSSNLRPSKSASIEPYELTKQDIDKLQKIFRLYEGTHDFKAFGGQIEQNEKRAMKKINTIRTVYRVELVKEPLKEDYVFGNESVISPPPQEQLGFIGEEGNYRIDFLLQGALYKMVRNMVGTAIECWLGRMSEEQLIELLRTEDATNEMKLGRKDNPCKPAPPEGLTLEAVYYDDNF
jgi:tRNA pseudouridine38-40 synthase